MSCTTFKITKYLVSILGCITSALFISVDFYVTFELFGSFVIPSFSLKDIQIYLLYHFNNWCVDRLSWDGTYPHNFYNKN